jgi:hypothetical protein
VVAALSGLGFGAVKSLDYHVLFRCRHHAGVRFAFEGVLAIWLVDADYLRFVDSTGNLFKIVRLDAYQQIVKKAA